jgi:hypothetical protein
MSKLDNLMTKIDHKVEQEAQVAIRDFRLSVDAALKKLLGYSVLSSQKEDVQRCIGNLLIEGKREWPGAIWNSRRAQIEEQILQSMDIVAKTLVAPEPSGDEREGRVEEVFS